MEKDMYGEHQQGKPWLNSWQWRPVVQKKTQHHGKRATHIQQGLCENLINALKLLANQQKDGDSPIQNIIMGLKEKYRERITNRLRSFIASDNCSAVEVGHLRRRHSLSGS